MGRKGQPGKGNLAQKGQQDGRVDGREECEGTRFTPIAPDCKLLRFQSTLISQGGKAAHGGGCNAAAVQVGRQSVEQKVLI